MPIARLSFEKRKDPLWMIITSIIIGEDEVAEQVRRDLHQS